MFDKAEIDNSDEVKSGFSWLSSAKSIVYSWYVLDKIIVLLDTTLKLHLLSSVDDPCFL